MRLLDRCGIHGYWLDGGELRRLAEWWRVGGKHLHQQHEAERVQRLNAPLVTPVPRGTIESPPNNPSHEFVDLSDLLWVVVDLFMTSK